MQRSKRDQIRDRETRPGRQKEWITEERGGGRNVSRKKTIKPKQNKSLHTNTQEGLDLYIRLSKKPHKH